MLHIIAQLILFYFIVPILLREIYDILPSFQPTLISPFELNDLYEITKLRL
jgi:hypothetical protein